MIQLSATIITYNEEEHIEKCLQSLQCVVDEIVVVDSFSTDQTKKICKKFDVRFIEQEFLGYKEQKNFAITKTSYDYILSLDGDEALSEELQKSILALKKDWKHDGYYCNRRNNYAGYWVKHSNWYPDKKLRLFKKGKGEWKGLNPHDSYKVFNSKSIGKLKGDILHWIYRDFNEHEQKTAHFANISAKSYFESGRKSSLFKIIFRPSWAFIKAYLFRLGFLDGTYGWIISKQVFRNTYIKYLELYKLQRNKKTI